VLGRHESFAHPKTLSPSGELASAQAQLLRASWAALLADAETPSARRRVLASVASTAGLAPLEDDSSSVVVEAWLVEAADLLARRVASGGSGHSHGGRM
jgi:hypothetical protein